MKISDGVIKQSFGSYLFFLAFFLAAFLFGLPGPLYIVISFQLFKRKSFLRLFDDENI